MSIYPVQPIGPDSGETYAEAHARTPATAPVPPAAKPAAPDPGAAPKQETHPAQNAPPPLELPQDEVQVQRDFQTNDDIVVRYMNHAGSLILQVPSTQILGLERAIDQDFQREAKARATAESAQVEGGKAHEH